MYVGILILPIFFVIATPPQEKPPDIPMAAVIASTVVIPAAKIVPQMRKTERVGPNSASAQLGSFGLNGAFTWHGVLISCHARPLSAFTGHRPLPTA